MTTSSYGAPGEALEAPYQAPASPVSSDGHHPHSGRGIASLGIALVLLAMLGLGTAYQVMGALETGLNVNSKGPVYLVLGMVFSVFGFACGAALAVTGLMQDGRKRFFAWLGVLVNVVSFLAIAGFLAYAVYAARVASNHFSA